jgi:hypothetical protein
MDKPVQEATTKKAAAQVEVDIDNIQEANEAVEKASGDFKSLVEESEASRKNYDTAEAAADVVDTTHRDRQREENEARQREKEARKRAFEV